MLRPSEISALPMSLRRPASSSADDSESDAVVSLTRELMSKGLLIDQLSDQIEALQSALSTASSSSSAEAASLPSNAEYLRVSHVAHTLLHSLTTVKRVLSMSSDSLRSLKSDVRKQLDLLSSDCLSLSSAIASRAAQASESHAAEVAELSSRHLSELDAARSEWLRIRLELQMQAGRAAEEADREAEESRAVKGRCEELSLEAARLNEELMQTRLKSSGLEATVSTLRLDFEALSVTHGISCSTVKSLTAALEASGKEKADARGAAAAAAEAREQRLAAAERARVAAEREREEAVGLAEEGEKRREEEERRAKDAEGREKKLADEVALIKGNLLKMSESRDEARRAEEDARAEAREAKAALLKLRTELEESAKDGGKRAADLERARDVSKSLEKEVARLGKQMEEDGVKSLATIKALRDDMETDAKQSANAIKILRDDIESGERKAEEERQRAANRLAEEGERTAACIRSLEEQLSESRAVASERSSTISHLESQVSSLTLALQSASAGSSSQDETLSSLSSSNAALLAKLAAKESEVDKLEATVHLECLERTALNETLQKLRRQVVELGGDAGEGEKGTEAGEDSSGTAAGGGYTTTPSKEDEEGGEGGGPWMGKGQKRGNNRGRKKGGALSGGH